MSTLRTLYLVVDRDFWCTAYVKETEEDTLQMIRLRGENRFQWKPDVLGRLIVNQQWPLKTDTVRILIRSARELDFPHELSLPLTRSWTEDEIADLGMCSPVCPPGRIGAWIINGSVVDVRRKRFPVHPGSSPAYVYTYPSWEPPIQGEQTNPNLTEILTDMAAQRQVCGRPDATAGTRSTLDLEIVQKLSDEKKGLPAGSTGNGRTTIHSMELEIMEQLSEERKNRLGK